MEFILQCMFLYFALDEACQTDIKKKTAESMDSKDKCGKLIKAAVLRFYERCGVRSNQWTVCYIDSGLIFFTGSLKPSWQVKHL